ncbi:hypothetical protein [Microbispora bryophytorum]|uniref:hypothetical protein n=1 Tax=Microbispora bryophytorum TaxID=1460882 RepID=UPI0033E27B38
MSQYGPLFTQLGCNRLGRVDLCDVEQSVGDAALVWVEVGGGSDDERAPVANEHAFAGLAVSEPLGLKELGRVVGGGRICAVRLCQFRRRGELLARLKFP